MNNRKFNEMVAKVRVTGGRFWYANRIGEIFNVIGAEDKGSEHDAYFKVEHPDNTEDSTYIVYVKDCEPVEIRYNNERYLLQERKAEVGEKIILIDYKESRHAYVNKYPLNNGDVFTTEGVDSDGDVLGVEEREYKNVINHKEYRVLVPIADTSKTASALTANVTVKWGELPQVIDMLTSLSQEVVELKREVHAFKESQSPFGGLKLHNNPFPIPQLTFGELPQPEVPKPAKDILTRAEVVAKAKSDLDMLKRVPTYGGEPKYIHQASPIVGYVCNAEFIVNREKRTVVALLKHKFNGVMAKGIARCAPDDVFHIEIGRAIALRRALGLPVPEEYVNAPKPEGVAVGDVVYLHNTKGTVIAQECWTDALASQVKRGIATVIDDSDREGACC